MTDFAPTQADAEAGTATERSPPSWLVAFAATALGYVALAVATIPLELAPVLASLLYPAAGLALAAVLLRGPSMAIAAAIASAAIWAVRFHVPPGASAATAAAVLLPLGIGAGVGLQAFLGGALVQRQLREPLALAEPIDVVRFIGAAALASLISSGVANSLLCLFGWLRVADLPLALLTWWSGDLLGTMLVVPLILAIRRTRSADWGSRARSVATVLVALILLIGVGFHGLVRQAVDQRDAVVRHDAETAAHALSDELRDASGALDALHGLFLAFDEVTADEMRLATRTWVSAGRVDALGWSVPVRPSDLAAFEASVRAAGMPGYRVGGASGASGGAATGARGPGDGEVVALRLVEPVAPNLARLGSDAMATPATRAAVERTRQLDAPAVAVTTSASGIELVAYRALLRSGASGRTAPRPSRAGELRGVVSVALRPEPMLARLAAREPDLWRRLDACLIDATAPGPALRLAGRVGCETLAADADERRTVRYADRELLLVARPAFDRGLWPAHREAWWFALIALATTALLSTFVLTITGRARRVELAVRQRTAALQAVAQDRQAAEHALRESEQRFREILDHVPIGVVHTDLDGRIRQANLHFCELVGIEEGSLVGRNLAQLTHPEDRTRDPALDRQLLRGEIPLFRRQRRLLAPEGQIVWVQITVSLMRGAKDSSNHLVSVVEDITEKRQLEEAERGRDAAEAANRAKSDFLSRMSHELRTPLNAMLGFAQLLELDPKQPLTPSQRPWVSQIQQAGWHLLEMINDMLDLSRIESGNLQLRIGPLDLRELVASTCAMVDADARERHLTISQHLALDTVTPLGDPTRVKQILTNLLTNAVKYNADSGGIRIAARSVDAEHVEVVVADTGIGMTPDQLAGLFQPFNRLGRERTSQAPGTGIGLVISQRLAELMGGTLTAQSAVGQGSAFVLTLPCSPEPETVRADLDDDVAGTVHTARGRIHYVEDNETNVEVMRGMLAQRPQVELSVSVTGLDGLAAIRTGRPDLILLDMNLPDISGMELLRHLKRDPVTRSIPIVVVSADALPAQIEDAFEAGCERYLTKPVSLVELLATVDDLIDGEAGAQR